MLNMVCLFLTGTHLLHSLQLTFLGKTCKIPNYKMSGFSLTPRWKSFMLAFHWCRDITRDGKGKDHPTLVQGNGKVMVKVKAHKPQI